jgi:hypothetical protein
MYHLLISLHSLVRWLLLVSLLLAIYQSYRGWLGRRGWFKWDNTLRVATVTLAHVQLGIGVYLYFKSPLIAAFFNNYSATKGIRDIRFFGMEHSLMMALAVTFITIGASKARRRQLAGQKFKAMAIWFTIALVIIFVSIPWPFSPMAARPWFREF